MTDLLNDNDDVMDSLLRALSDPGSVLPRAPLEGLVSWQRRAVIEHAAPHITAAARPDLKTWPAVEELIAEARAEAAAAERERIRQEGGNPIAGRCAYEAFAVATRESLNLPAWDRIPADARIDWQMTADALLMFVTMEARDA